MKSLATDEIGLNEALEAAGITPLETDLAELIVQLAGERPSHLLVPAIHKNRAEIRDLFRDTLGDPELPDDPAALAEAARLHLREAFLRARVAISGANFAVAETGTVCVVESEGNGRMCTTLPETLITVMGIEKAIPALPRPRGLPPAAAALVDRRADEPVHVALDGRARGRRAARVPPRAARRRAARRVLADPAGGRRSAASAARPASTSARSTGRPAATPTTALRRARSARSCSRSSRASAARSASLPFASSLCGACYDVCPVGSTSHRSSCTSGRRSWRGARPDVEGRALQALGRAFATRRRYERAQRLGRSLQRPVARDGWITLLPAGPARRLGALARPARRCRAADVPRVVGGAVIDGA